MDEKTPVESIGLAVIKNGVQTQGIFADKTPKQANALDRIGWSLFPNSGDKQVLHVVMAAITLAEQCPGLFTEAVRAMNFTIHLQDGTQIRPAPPASSSRHI